MLPRAWRAATSSPEISTQALSGCGANALPARRRRPRDATAAARRGRRGRAGGRAARGRWRSSRSSAACARGPATAFETAAATTASDHDPTASRQELSRLIGAAILADGGRGRTGRTAELIHSHHAKRRPAALKISICRPTPDPLRAHHERAEASSRPEAIAELRRSSRASWTTDHCVCAVADRLGFPCHGFAQLSDEEFRQRFDWIAKTRPGATRKELEESVNLYLLGRQEVTGAAIACDVETREHDLCGGWTTFDNPKLEEFYRTVFGRAGPDRLEPPATSFEERSER